MADSTTMGNLTSQLQAVSFNAAPASTETKPTQFLDLSTELRIQIWEYVCPDLRAQPRMLDCAIRSFAKSAQPDVLHIVRGLNLAEKTRSLRCVLAVHQDSRSLALSVFPDKLTLERYKKGRTGDIWFHKRRDVFYMNTLAGSLKLPCSRTTAGLIEEFAPFPRGSSNVMETDQLRIPSPTIPPSLLARVIKYDNASIGRRNNSPRSKGDSLE